MTTPGRGTPPLTVREYLRREESAELRHEYVAGELFAMTGATVRHNRIAGNIFAHLWSVARGGPCRVQMSDVKLRAAEDAIYYPDVMVVCDEPPESPVMERAPCLVVEVTSPSTMAVDRREKLLAYTRMPSVRAYLIVDQARRHVERHWRDADASWRREEITGAGRVAVPCPELQLSLEEIYEGVELEP
ncbi:MAG TPA: Uma2 family endonuclease [Longimicrobiales bacterium]|nr:Uma2 family endonuclease [Longimicrobiales bacterium]